MPALIPEEVYVASGRRDNFGSSMFSLKDRFNKSYVLGPTHEGTVRRCGGHENPLIQGHAAQFISVSDEVPG